MIWLDIIDPKYVLFFNPLIPKLKELDEVIITTRKSKEYSECWELLELFNISNICVGGYGGESPLGKFNARLDRQKAFLELFEKTGIPKLFITGASVDGVQTAYALGIPIVNFSDTPLKNDHFDIDSMTILSKLTLPLSSLIFHPFVVPEICYASMGVPAKNIISYDFIDIALWLKDMQPGIDFRKTFNIPQNRPSILFREEEYKAHYVKEKLPIIYESIEKIASCLDVNVVIMPRYGKEGLYFKGFENIFIIEEKLPPADFYPFIDILVGGGGTMNLEACYLGIPTISTRSLFLFHDKYLLNNHLMRHCKNSQEVYEEVKSILATKKPSIAKKANARKLFEPKPANFEEIFKTIKERFYA
ncbi:DUF354 domain-containing protein [Helicobacter cappadocius]|uniref:DUF354 domain-containing protein n=1 Tax=Helicobacter cappadocius TaxID=3063998 RepID=A0AA90PQP4_9HELI|nr:MULTISPECIES: DUF354 domain-containing protein [unclassified Helicobacter]MDO7252495.1 DUF354 domain-containing protein [Helicobacter sp. faydin-H75]MDP2538362.1 DUF354 domain-containing protein [Helicobacter sp. faydin-H76]